MTFLAFNAGLIAYVATHIMAFVYSPNVRRLWVALVRLGGCLGLLALPWLVLWQYPNSLRWLMHPYYLNLNLVTSILVPAVLSLLLLKLAYRLDLKPRWIPDLRDDTNPVATVALLPFAIALVACLAVIIGQAVVGWLLTDYVFRYLPVLGPLSHWAP